MKQRILLPILLLVLILITSSAYAQGDAPQAPLGTAFTYQGQLKDDAGNPINATCDLRFTLWDAGADGTQIDAESLAAGVTVTDGYFTAQVNAASEFGAAAFDGSARWLEVSVRCPAGSGEYTMLSPRQALTAAPYAAYASQAAAAPWSGLTGIPAGFADGVDNNTAYTAGDGLALTGTQFSVTGAPWSGLTSVPAGFADGVDNDTTYTAGTGLRLASSEFSIATGYLLPQSCTGGQVIKWNVLSSRWVCSTDSDTTYTAGSGLVLAGTEFSVTGAPWSGLTSVPAGFADSVDDTGSDWHLTGNSGTTPDTDFLGTTDNQMLVFKVNGLTALRLEPNINAPNIIGGRSNNSVTAGVHGATIAGGGANAAPNQVTEDFGTVGGGYKNTAGGSLSTISGGTANTASNYGATVSGGCGNTASAAGSVVAGGGCFDGGYTGNDATGIGSTVSGGIANEANGYASTVGGGRSNRVDGDYSFAAGYRAKNTNNLHDGVFMFADSNAFDFNSTAANQFRVRSTGGAQFVTAIDGSGNVTAGVQVAPGGGSWTSLSDRNLKANFTTVSGRAVLNAVAAMPISTWNYIAQDESIRHIGPMAQDFYTAFSVGEDNTHIATVDADGVALAAIQGLNEIVQEKDTQIAALETRIAALEQTANGVAASPLATPWPWLALTVLGLAVILRRTTNR